MNSCARIPMLPSLAAALITLLAAGCGRDDVKVYKVDHQETAAPPARPAGAMPSSMPAGLPAPDNSVLPTLKYTLPAGWQEKTLTQLRVASFEIAENGKTADLSVIPLSGAAGGDFPNVNRWRGQVGLPSLADNELPKLAEKIEVAGLAADLYDVAGTAPGSGEAERILGVILHRDDTAWFFKLTGDADLVAKHKAAFVTFLKTLEFGGLPAPSTMDLSQLPPSHPAIPGLNPAGAAAPAAEAADKPAWTVPAGWQEGQLAQFLIAKFVVTDANGARAEVNVSRLDGDGGGFQANVNRWRRQIGLGPVDPSTPDLPARQVDSGGIQSPVVDFTGTNAASGKPARLVGVVVPQNGQTWFYKLMGDADLVGAQTEAFFGFVKSAKYPAPR